MSLSHADQLHQRPDYLEHATCWVCQKYGKLGNEWDRWVINGPYYGFVPTHPVSSTAYSIPFRRDNTRISLRPWCGVPIFSSPYATSRLWWHLTPAVGLRVLSGPIAPPLCTAGSARVSSTSLWVQGSWDRRPLEIGSSSGLRGQRGWKADTGIANPSTQSHRDSTPSLPQTGPWTGR